jgi:acetyl-CoA C-acetyltransferase
MLSRKVAIVGTGVTKFGENFEQGYNDLLVDACGQAFADAGIESKQIEAAWLGTYLP